MLEPLQKLGWTRDGKDDATVVGDFFRVVVPTRHPPRFNIMSTRAYNNSRGWKKGDEVTFVLSGTSTRCARRVLAEDTLAGPPADDLTPKGRLHFDVVFYCKLCGAEHLSTEKLESSGVAKVPDSLVSRRDHKGEYILVCATCAAAPDAPGI
jgi:hypothetical protein